MNAPEEIWRRVVAEIPSRHIGADHLEHFSGVRKRLIEGIRDTIHSCARLRYLEIGCRRGHSLACALLAASGPTHLEATVVDVWIDGYGDEPNSTPGQIMGHVRRLDPRSEHTVRFTTGDSHSVLPWLASDGERFDIILVDGDHTYEGARQDLEDSLKLSCPGTLILFDDTNDAGLLRVFDEFVHAHPDRIALGSVVKHTYGTRLYPEFAECVVLR